LTKVSETSLKILFLIVLKGTKFPAIAAGVKLQKGSLGSSDLRIMPRKLKIFCGKVIKKSLNFIEEYLYAPWLSMYV